MEVESDFGNLFSPIISGTWKWGEQLSVQGRADFISQAVDLGVTAFDTAHIYGAHTEEEAFGNALKSLPGMRERISITTKYGIKMPAANRDYTIKSFDTGREHMIWSVENSLRMLQTDRIDVLLIHRPSPLMDPDEVATAVDDLLRAGKIRSFGVSNFTPSQLELIASRVECVTNQIEASVLHLDPFKDGSFDLMLRIGVIPTIWSPLASGRLFTQKNERIDRVKEAAQSLVEKYNAQGIDEIYLAWLMRHPSAPVPVIGTSKIPRLESALRATEIDLERDDWFKIWIASTGEQLP